MDTHATGLVTISIVKLDQITGGNKGTSPDGGGGRSTVSSDLVGTNDINKCQDPSQQLSQSPVIGGALQIPGGPFVEAPVVGCTKKAPKP